MRQILLTIFFLFVVIAISAESYFRFVAPVTFRANMDGSGWVKLLHQKSRSSDLVYELAPDKKVLHEGTRYQTNFHGMRDKDPDNFLPERIAFLGDEKTFGQNIDLEDIFAEQVEDSFPSLEVLNMGTSGYSIHDEYEWFAAKGVELSPKLLVLFYSLDDPEDRVVTNLKSHYLGKEWWQHSHFLRFLMQQRIELESLGAASGDYHLSLHENDDRWQRVEDTLGEFQSLSEEKNIPLAVVLMPTLDHENWKRYPHYGIHFKIMDTLSELKIPTLDMAKYFRQSAPAELRHESGQMSVIAHDITTKELNRWIMELREQGLW